MRVLALDLGFTVGWACGLDTDIPHCGSAKPVGADLGEFCCSYADWFARMLSAEEPNEIVIEGGTPIQTIKSPDIALKMANMLGLTVMIARRRNFPKPTLLHVGTIRKFVVGSGHARDPEIMRAVVELGCRPTDEHAADACAVWMYKAGRKWRPARVAA